MAAPKAILELVEHFDNNAAYFRSNQYNETELRREFLDPLFEALGWDVNNKGHIFESYKDVVHEPSRETEQGVPDYCFRIGGTPKFYLEAKKPGVNIKDNPDPVLQIRRYGWSSKLPLSLLSNFAEFAVYDCRIAPKQGDKPSTARVTYYTYREFAEKWDEIAGRFSKEAILKGSFDQFVQSSKLKKGTAEVDSAFLSEIEDWRRELASNIASRNPKLSPREINFSVQRTIDRIIFLRICEDRGLEPYGQLRDLLQGSGVYQRLCELFKLADARYNSGLFHFHTEKGRNESPDEITPKLYIDDARLKSIVKRLYYPESPYAFSHVPAEILGQVYEQFLGQVIRITPGHQAKVEPKPEVKKAGGVYYTPAYIVDYIVRNTVGKLLEGKTPKQAARIRVLDPACGSGSFLIGAYQFLLNWYLDSYANGGKPRNEDKDRIYRDTMGNWRLTLAEKKQILLRHIYGVDIDTQAVEVTKLSLLLKVLEGETQLKLFHERALPDLGNNIKCGNSLIGPDFYENQQMFLLDEEDRYRINVFDWKGKEGFAEIVKDGGFDAVIGNPPYGASFSDIEKEYIKFAYKSYLYRFDSYIYFIEKGLQLARQGGYVAYITPELWLRLDTCAPLRQLVSDEAGLLIVKVCGEGVFSAAVVNTVVFLLARGEPEKHVEIQRGDEKWKLRASEWRKREGRVINYKLRPEVVELVEKVRVRSDRRLSDFGDSIQGITPYDKYAGQSEKTIKSRAYHFDSKRDKTCGKWLAGTDVHRYSLGWSGEWLSYGEWLAAPRDPDFFTGPRLLFREVPGQGKRLQVTLADETLYHGHSITPFKPFPECKLDLRYILALANSKLISWYGALTLPNFGKEIFPKVNPQDVKALPIRSIDSRKSEVKCHDRLTKLVDQILELNSSLGTARTDHERTVIQRQIEATDRQIDKLVYELYDLTDDEIAIIENATAGQSA